MPVEFHDSSAPFMLQKIDGVRQGMLPLSERV
jgi:hypothetical protein